MKRLLLITALLLGGCDTDNTFIDLSFIYPDCPACPAVDCPECNDSVDGYLTELTDRIDVNSVKLNHYVDEVKIDENYAELIDIDGRVATKNHINLPKYTGTPMRHVLIIEFIQTK